MEVVNLSHIKNSEIENDDTPQNRLVDNALAEAEQSNSKMIKNCENNNFCGNSLKFQSFYKYLRRHEDNIFNALFYDKEDYSEDILKERILEICDFFDLLMNFSSMKICVKSVSRSLRWTFSKR